MAIRLETYDLVGMASDVLGFAPSSRTSRELSYLRFCWTGERLEISTHAVTYGAVATWTPSGNLGGDDPEWEILLRTKQVKDIVDLFKLNGTAAQLPVTLDHRHGMLVLSRERDEERGIDPRRQTYVGIEDDYRDMRTQVEFADLGEVDFTQPVGLPLGVLTGLQKAVKRTETPAFSTPRAKGIRTAVGGHLDVYSRYPLEVDEAKEHADTVTAVALGDA